MKELKVNDAELYVFLHGQRGVLGGKLNYAFTEVKCHSGNFICENDLGCDIIANEKNETKDT